MNAESQFWWSWWVNFFVAVATIGAVLAALFGDWFKSRAFSPKLKLGLRDTIGERTTVTLQWQTEEGLQQRKEDARYYHIRVSNSVRWPSSNQTQVYILRIEEPGPDGELQVKWSGELPVQWTHQTIYPVARTIGSGAYCDLCSVVKDKWVQLHPLIVPNNFPLQYKEATILVVSLQARGNESESPVARFQISWDGRWEDGDSEMTRHLVVKDITK